MTSHSDVPGRFWQPGIDRVADGTLRVGGEGKPQLIVDEFIFEESSVAIKELPNGEIQKSRSFDPAKQVSDFGPRTIWGITKGDAKVTLLEAYGGNDIAVNLGLGQSFHGRFCISGDHVETDDKYESARYSIDGMFARNLIGSSTDFATLGGGHLKAYEEDGETWIEFSIDNGATIREYENHALLPCITLEGIARRRVLHIRSAQIRKRNHADWLTVHTDRSSRPFPTKSLNKQWLTLESLTAERLAAWMQLSMDAEGLVDAVAGLDDSAPIQSQMIVLGAITEGVHRKLYRASVAFPDLDRAQRRAVRRAAKEAATKVLQDFGISDQKRIDTAMDNALNSFNDVRFRTRLEELSLTALTVDPNMLSSFSDWPRSVMYARNQIVHQLDLADDTDVDLTEAEKAKVVEEHFDLVIASVFSLSWLLKVVLLTHAGFPQEDIRDGLLKHSPYLFSQANIADLLQGHPHGAPQESAVVD